MRWKPMEGGTCFLDMQNLRVTLERNWRTWIGEDEFERRRFGSVVNWAVPFFTRSSIYQGPESRRVQKVGHWAIELVPVPWK